MPNINYQVVKPFHDAALASTIDQLTWGHSDTHFTYTFENFFHPFVGELIGKLNKESLAAMLDANWQDGLKTPDPNKDPAHDFFHIQYNPTDSDIVKVISFPKEIDVDVLKDGPYANYNWELFFHIPLMVAVHLSKNQRFAEAQRWFHYIFDPTCNDKTVDPLKRFWKFLAFRNGDIQRIEDIVRLLSMPDDKSNDDQQTAMKGYAAILNKPFQPHAVARTRLIAYEYNVVMKYLDNLIAWGDTLFQQDTIESINEATQIYILAKNVLGRALQQTPPTGTTQAYSYAQLKQRGLGRIGDALVDLEAQFPFNLANFNQATGTNNGGSNALLGMGRALYFCIPPNQKLLGYWDTVADRLFKIRHCMNIAGVVRSLALFDPPIDPGMLVKAAAAGIDIGSIVNGLNQPIGPVRALIIIQKSLELCGEVRGLGNSLLSALEKGDAEHLALIRQKHEIQIEQMTQDVRFLQWKAAQEATTSLLTSRKTGLEQLNYYRRLLGITPDPNAPDTVNLDRRELTEENFNEAYNTLVGQYDKQLTLNPYPKSALVGDSSPSQQSGAAGSGYLYLNPNENAELNEHLPKVKDNQALAFVSRLAAPIFSLLPGASANIHFWGLGGTLQFGGPALTKNVQTAAEVLDLMASREHHDADSAAKTSVYQRRADEWLLHYNLAAHEMMQNGRQILTSLIAEQIAHHDYLNIQQQIANSQEIQSYLDAVNFPDKAKFTNEELYLWMQGEISRLYYEYYRFAFDTARKAERTMKQELMRPELDTQDFVQFNYWDGGRKGLLSGEALYLDVKRMEMAYHDNNKRELELTKHVSLRQLNPIALLALKTTGTCQVTIPEWVYDLDCPGHYMRRIKNVALSIPSVAGPYTSVNCTLSLLKSSLRKSSIAGDDYTRQGTEDDRFVDYIGAVQSIVTSTGQTDSGMFETNLRDERFLPFEGSGGESTWKLDLPKDYRAFDYDTISDVILHVRYTARQGVDPIKVKDSLDTLFSQANQTGLALLFSLRHDFPTEWAAFVNSSDPNAAFTATIRKDYFPYFAQREIGQGKTITVGQLQLYDGNDVSKHHPLDQAVSNAANDGLNDKTKQAFTLTAPEDPAGPTQVLTRKPDAEIFLIVPYMLGA